LLRHRLIAIVWYNVGCGMCFSIVASLADFHQT
jgi:hypothetical protein